MTFEIYLFITKNHYTKILFLYKLLIIKMVVTLLIIFFGAIHPLFFFFFGIFRYSERRIIISLR